MNGISQQFVTRVSSHGGLLLISFVMVEQAEGRQLLEKTPTSAALGFGKMF